MLKYAEYSVLVLTVVLTVLILILVFYKVRLGAPKSMIFIILMYGLCILSRMPIVFFNLGDDYALIVSAILIRVVTSMLIELVL